MCLRTKRQALARLFERFPLPGFLNYLYKGRARCFVQVNTETFEHVLIKDHPRNQRPQIKKKYVYKRARNVWNKKSFYFLAQHMIQLPISFHYVHLVDDRPEIRSTERKRKCYVQVGDFWTLIKSSAHEMQSWLGYKATSICDLNKLLRRSFRAKQLTKVLDDDLIFCSYVKLEAFKLGTFQR